jgi:hypothetical protein
MDALFWMGAGWVFYYVLFAVWTPEAFAAWRVRLSVDPVMMYLYLYFLLVALINLLRYLNAHLQRSVLAAPLWGVLPVGVFLYLLGFFLSAVFSVGGDRYVGVGDQIAPPWDRLDLRVGAVEPGLPEEVVDTGGEEGLILAYEPRVYLDGQGVRHEVGVFPPTRVGKTYFHILDFGVAPGVRILRGSRVVAENYILQRLLPPGAQDSFEVPPLPYRFVIRLLPVRTVRKGDAEAMVYRPSEPHYRVVVEKGGEILFDGETSGEIAFDGLRAEFLKPDYWVRLEGQRNAGYRILALGIALMLLGLPLHLAAMACSAWRRVREARSAEGAP